MTQLSPAPTSADLAPEARQAPPPPPPGLGPRELLRWAWRQLTSMRTALLLLLLLAVASVPGSVVPQADVDAIRVSQWRQDHPGLASLYDRLGLFSVFDSPWFSAIYLLLMVSLVGCILPRSAVYWRALRAAPPPAPRNLSRLPAYVRLPASAEPAALADHARGLLGSRRYRVAGPVPGARSDGSVAAERGQLREAGNLLFHISVIVVLVGFAVGQLFGYKGGMIVVVGDRFSNTLNQYDDFAPGSLFDPESLVPLTFRVDDFRAKFIGSGPQAGQPVGFHADLTYKDTLGAPERNYRLEVNRPLQVEGADVFLVGHGYAPIVTVRDGNGDLSFKGPVVFLPQDQTFASSGVVKVAEARPEQLALEGMFYPTFSSDGRNPFSAFPDALDPVLSVFAYHGDLGLDSGRPQSVYALDGTGLAPFQKADGKPFRLDLRPGDRAELPDGLGTVHFDGYQRWVKLQVSDSPAKGVALAGIVLGLIGLMGSLFVRRRRVWVRVTPRPGGSWVEVAGLDKSSAGEGLQEEVAGLADRLVGAVPDTAGGDPRNGELS